MERPFFSIIVVSFNAAPYIRKTIESVLAQDFTDYEIVVKDAASTDGTLDEIPKDDRIRVYSEKDTGVYDGMNAAIEYATGKYLLFLNCGDYLPHEHVFSDVYKIAKDKDEGNTILYGDFTRRGVRFKPASRLTPFYLYRTPLCHQTEFFGCGIFEKERYETRFVILGDYNLTLKTFFAGYKYVYVPTVVADYLGGGASESPKGIAMRRRERAEILSIHF